MQPHDRFFGRLLGRIDNACDALRWLLPPRLVQQLEWDSLRPAPTRTTQASERRGDLAFRIRTLDGHPLEVHILFEHQRDPEFRTVFRVLEYEARTWLQQIEAREPVIRVVPLVLYNGARPWPHPTSVEAAMPEDGLEPDLGGLQVRGGFLLADLSQIPDDALSRAALGAHLRLGLWLLKHAPQLDQATFWPRFTAWLSVLAEIYALADGASRLRALLDYIASVVGEPSEDNLNIIGGALPEPVKETVMTWAEALTQRGEERGRTKHARQTLRRQLTLRYGDLSSEITARIDEAPVDQLDRWLDRIVIASTLDEVFADQT